MSLHDTLLTALKGLRANKLRSSLTMLGMVVGIAAVIALMSLGYGTQNFIFSQIRSMGTNLLIVRPGSTPMGAEVSYMSSGTSSLTLDDAKAIARSCPSVAKVAPEAMIGAKVTFGDQEMKTIVAAGTPETKNVYNTSIEFGRSLTWEDMQARSMVCVLGSSAAEYLFQGINPIGQRVKIKGRPFKVIGVYKSTGGMMMSDIVNNSISVPLTAAQGKILTQYSARGSLEVQTIYARIWDESKMEEAKEEITNLLRQRHHLRPTDDNDFHTVSPEKMMKMTSKITGMLTIFLGGIAGISLLVGGIGIMNIMFVSVRERTREIGIRRAVGAKRRDILLQFLAEAIMLCLIGGAIGIFVGYGISYLASYIIETHGYAFTPVISLDIVALAFGVAAGIGLIFGIFPAIRAGRLNPIDALRYE